MHETKYQEGRKFLSLSMKVDYPPPAYNMKLIVAEFHQVRAWPVELYVMTVAFWKKIILIINHNRPIPTANILVPLCTVQIFSSPASSNFKLCVKKLDEPGEKQSQNDHWESNPLK